MTTKNSYRLGGHPGYQAPHSSVGNQAESEKLATGTDSTQEHEQHLTERYSQEGSHAEQQRPAHNINKTRTIWSRQEYLDVMKAHYEGKGKGTSL